MPAYFAYYRVSTQKQGVSSFRLEAQQAAVVSVLQGGQPQGEYVEVESGEQNQRPQLLAAMAAARAVGGGLLIDQCDRLSRNASFILTLRDSGVDFVCCDMPSANILTVGLLAVLAQPERETILKRTKDALAAKKARGAQLGTLANLTQAAREQLLLVRQAQIQQHPGLRQTAAFIASRRAQGVSFRQLAGQLNALGFTAPRGESFNQKQVQRFHERTLEVA